MRERAAAGLAAAFGLLLAAFSLPISAWWPGGMTQGRYGDVALLWALWAIIAAGLSVVAGLVPALAGSVLAPVHRALQQAGSEARWSRTVLAASAVTLLLAALAAQGVFSGRPLLIDEMVQVFQARLFAEGRLWEPAPPSPVFTSALNLVEHEGRVFGHFPPGQALWLALGEFVGARWLMTPLAAALGTAAFGLLLRRVEASPAVRALALAVAAVSPFAVFMAGTQMNHTLLSTLWLVALAGAADGRQRGLAVSGAAIGFAACVRPLDAALLAAGLGVVLLAVESRRPGRLVLWGGGIVAGSLPLFLFNAATTGHPLLLGYSLLWGRDVGLGFGGAPWGEPFTPQIGLERMGSYVVLLQGNFLEVGMPGLLPAILGLLAWRWHRPAAPVETAWLLTAVALVASYTAYWHNGVFLGPRFLHPLVPLLALWTARGVARVWSTPRGLGQAATAGAAAACVVGATLLLPDRVAEYRTMMQASRFDGDAALAAAGVERGTVFVPESWGAQVIARLWAVGVPRWTAERLYRAVDLCRLDRAIRPLEAAGRAATSAELDALLALVVDSAQTRASPFSADTTQRWQRTQSYDQACRLAIIRQQAGIAVAAPLRLAGPTRVTWARDLGPANAQGTHLPTPWWRLRVGADGRQWIEPYAEPRAN